MPGVIDPSVCDCHFAGCFPVRVCPAQAFSFDAASEQVVIDSDLCAACPGRCVDFCDRYAIRYASNAEEFDVLKARTLGTLSEAEAAEELHRLKQRAEEAVKAQSVIAEGSAATFKVNIEAESRRWRRSSGFGASRRWNSSGVGGSLTCWSGRCRSRSCRRRSTSSLAGPARELCGGANPSGSGRRMKHRGRELYWIVLLRFSHAPCYH
jgi:hypothetical protein